MYKLFAFWSAPKPEDVEAFEEYYRETHCPRAAAVPYLERISVTRAGDGFEGSTPLYYRIAEMTFTDKAGFEASTQSPEWATMRECSGDIIARFGVSMSVVLGEETVLSPQPLA